MACNQVLCRLISRDPSHCGFASFSCSPSSLEVPQKFSCVVWSGWAALSLLVLVQESILTIWRYLTIFPFSIILENFDTFDNLNNLDNSDHVYNFWQFWQLWQFFDNCWQFLTILTIFDNFWQFLTIFNNFDNFWMFSEFWGVFRVFESFCDLRQDTWDTDYISDNWEQQYGQLYCDLLIESDGDSIRNSCDVWN